MTPIQINKRCKDAIQMKRSKLLVCAESRTHKTNIQHEPTLFKFIGDVEVSVNEDVKYVIGVVCKQVSKHYEQTTPHMTTASTKKSRKGKIKMRTTT